MFLEIRRLSSDILIININIVLGEPRCIKRMQDSLMVDLSIKSFIFSQTLDVISPAAPSQRRKSASFAGPLRVLPIPN